MAKAGSCRIGLKPNPLSWIWNVLSNGFDVKMINSKNPILIIAWVSKVFEIKTKLF